MARKRHERPRVLLYAVSNVGLGPVFRILRSLAEMRRLRPDLDALLITDRRDLIVMEGAPETAILKLPEYDYNAGGFESVPHGLNCGKAELRRIRAEIIRSAARSFSPDLFLADTAPHGKLNELVPTLKSWRWSLRRPVTALMMRDIPSPPGERFRWAGDPARTAREARWWDHIFIAGDEKFFDAPASYGWPDPVRRKVEHVGFVIPPSPDTGCENPGETIRDAPRRVALSFGGGWEVGRLGGRWIDAFDQVSNELNGSDDHGHAANGNGHGHGAASFNGNGHGNGHVNGNGAGHGRKLELHIVTGPGVSDEVFDALKARAASRPEVRVERFTPELHRILTGSDLAILQAGSTVYQILDSDIPVLLYAREHSSAEQICRAQALSRLPNVRALDRETVLSGDLAAPLREALAAPRQPRRTGYSFRGATRVAEILLGRLQQ